MASVLALLVEVSGRCSTMTCLFGEICSPYFRWNFLAEELFEVVAVVVNLCPFIAFGFGIKDGIHVIAEFAGVTPREQGRVLKKIRHQARLQRLAVLSLTP